MSASIPTSLCRSRFPGLLLAGLLLTGLLPTPSAHAEDGAASPLDALKQARKAKDADGVVAAMGRLVEAHNASEDKKLRGSIQSALGGLLKEKKLEAVPGQAAFSLGQLNDADGAFKQLKSVLPTAKTPGKDTLAPAVLSAVAELKPEGAVAPLLKLLAKGKDPVLLEPAVKALGGYAGSKQKQAVAQGLLDALARFKKDHDKAEKIKKAADKLAKQAPWVRVGPAVATALNELTGQQREGAADWLAALAEAKGNVAALLKSD